MHAPALNPESEQGGACHALDLAPRLPKSLGLLEDLERLVERRERAMVRGPACQVRCVSLVFEHRPVDNLCVLNSFSSPCSMLLEEGEYPNTGPKANPAASCSNIIYANKGLLKGNPYLPRLRNYFCLTGSASGSFGRSAKERTSWALGLLCVAALTSASFSARSMLRSKACGGLSALLEDSAGDFGFVFGLLQLWSGGLGSLERARQIEAVLQDALHLKKAAKVQLIVFLPIPPARCSYARVFFWPGWFRIWSLHV